MKTPLINVLTSILLLAACSSGTDSKAPLVASAVKYNQPARTDGIILKVDRSVVLKEDLSNLEAFERGLNIYAVTIQIPNAIAQELKITRVHDRNSQRISEALFQYEDDKVTITDAIDLNSETLGEQNFEYQLESIGKEIQPLSFSIKPDLVIIGSKLRSQLLLTNANLLDVGTLFIDTDSSLITEGGSLEINAETIISKKGQIETFTEAAAAVPVTNGERGTTGGNLKVTTNLLVGNINIFMRGKRGGQAVGALPRRDDDIPAQTGPGEDSSIGSKCLSWAYVAPETQFINALRELPPMCEVETCAKHATNGQVGAKGFIGLTGPTGMQGGDTGVLLFVAAKSLQNKVNVTLIPGAGGEPGEPGPGGKGGYGGPGGASRNSIYCPAGKQGERGPDGDRGEKGVQGAPGLEQKPTMILNGKTE